MCTGEMAGHQCPFDFSLCHGHRISVTLLSLTFYSRNSMKDWETGTDQSVQAHPMNLALPPDCETLVNLLNLSQLQFPPLQNGDNNSYLKK